MDREPSENSSLFSYSGGSGVRVLGPRSLHLLSMLRRIAGMLIPWARIAITSRVIPVQMSQPNDMVSSRIRPSG